ncbi:MAG: hypothetical protein IK115_11660 [Lachnospiraceae bacterium]|nr:hypothetical protein [Lachnospiraceae bacterium]
MRKKLIRILICVSAVAALAAAAFLLWMKGVFLPGWIDWKERELGLSDGRSLTLSGRRLYLEGESFPGMENYLVQDALLLDLDRDGEEELVLLLWKRGRYGPYRPFWVEKDEAGWSQHLFLYELPAEEPPKSKWCSSYMGFEAADMRVFEKGQGLLAFIDTQGEESIWAWEGFGVKRLD